MFGDSNDENNFLQVSKLCQAFANNSSANIKLSKTQFHKIVQSVGFLGRLLRPLKKTGLSLIGNVLKPLPKSVLIPLGLMTATSATDAAIHKKMARSCLTTIIVSDEEMNDIMKIFKSLEVFVLLINEVSETIKNEPKEQREGFLGMLLGTLGTSLLGNLLTGKGTIRAGEGAIGASEKF